MAYPYEPQPSPAAIFGPQYCAQFPLDLTVVKKVMTVSEGNLSITDVNDNIVFKVKSSFLTLHERRVLLDATDIPIATLRRKVQLYSFIFFYLIT